MQVRRDLLEKRGHLTGPGLGGHRMRQATGERLRVQHFAVRRVHSRQYRRGKHACSLYCLKGGHTAAITPKDGPVRSRVNTIRLRRQQSLNHRTSLRDQHIDLS